MEPSLSEEEVLGNGDVEVINEGSPITLQLGRQGGEAPGEGSSDDQFRRKDTIDDDTVALGPESRKELIVESDCFQDSSQCLLREEHVKVFDCP